MKVYLNLNEVVSGHHVNDVRCLDVEGRGPNTKTPHISTVEIASLAIILLFKFYVSLNNNYVVTMR